MVGSTGLIRFDLANIKKLTKSIWKHLFPNLFWKTQSHIFLVYLSLSNSFLINNVILEIQVKLRECLLLILIRQVYLR